MRKLRVLIVDDSVEDIKRAADILTEGGHSVITASNGKEGFDVAQNEMPDVILMDVVMPALNGFQATRQLSKNEKTCNIPIIVVSGKDQETDKVWALRQGAKAYLTKAVEKKSLFETINKVVG